MNPIQTSPESSMHNCRREAKPVSPEEGGVLVYVDNSNVWINTMAHSVTKLKLLNDITHDQRVRINITTLLETAITEKRPVIRCVLYGSEPPAVTDFWRNVSDCQFCNVELQISHRSSFTKREREVDQSINLNIGEDIVKYQAHTKFGGTLILFTGDGGMVAAVRKALDYNWKVELWSYNESLANVYKEEIHQNLKIQPLDDWFTEFAYYAHDWKNKVSKERSFVITLKGLPKEDKKNIMTILAEEATDLVKIPMSGCYLIREGYEDPDFKHLALVCHVRPQFFHEDSRSLGTFNKSTWDYLQKKDESFPLSQETHSRMLDLVYPYGQVPKDFKIKDFQEGLDKIFYTIYKEKEKPTNDIKHDFNKEVFKKVVADLLRYERYTQDENINLPIQRIISSYKPLIRTYHQFIEDMNAQQNAKRSLNTKASPLGTSEEFKVVTFRNQNPKKKYQKFSDPCKYGYRCYNGEQCVYAHDRHEEDYFKQQPDPVLRAAYKRSECDHFNNKRCKFTGFMSYKCPFAHGEYCKHCKKDYDGGHRAATCPFDDSARLSPYLPFVSHGLPPSQPPRPSPNTRRYF